MDDCIFCKLANGEIPTDMVYQDDKIAVFRVSSTTTDSALPYPFPTIYRLAFSISSNCMLKQKKTVHIPFIYPEYSPLFRSKPIGL